MNKILAGFLGLVMVTAVVGGTAYALFSSTATASTVTFATGNADLRVWNDSSWETNWTSNWSFSGMYPGYQSTATVLQLKNVSSSPITLGILMQLTNGGTNWSNVAPGYGTYLRDAVRVAVNDSTDSVNIVPWTTLASLNATPVSLGSLAQNSQALYNVHVQLPSGYGNEVANLSLPGVVFTFTGTQQ